MNEKEYMKRAMKGFADNGFQPIALIATGIEFLIHEKYLEGAAPETVVATYKQEHGIS